MNALNSLIDRSAKAAESSGTNAARSDAELGSEDRFLKLLVAQMQNQDPLNPLDNAQVTSQIAQINTVNGIEKLNRTMEAVSGRFSQLQTLQGAALVGRNVMVEGNRLTPGSDGVQQGAFELPTAASRVTLELLGSRNEVIERVDLGARESGRHSFDFRAKSTADLASIKTFRVVAQAGGVPVTTTPLMLDRVDAVATGGDTLKLDLRASGRVDYERIKIFN